MQTTRLGKTGLIVTKTAFGVLPLQRVDMAEAARILRRALDGGINFYDTARGYTDSEEKIGNAFFGVRESVIIATKSGSSTRRGLMSDLETSLRNLRTDHVDLLQLHNPPRTPYLDDPESAYAGLVEAREKGFTRFIGVTNHSLERADEMVRLGVFDTLQYPLSMISAGKDLDLADLCGKLDLGFIAMKPLSGGLLTNARTAFAFMRQYSNIVPIWGFQRMGELEELLELEANPPALDEEMLALIERERSALAGDFCRGCGYCLPCPADIHIPMAARMDLLLKRMPTELFLTREWRERMDSIGNCQDCGHCRENCPYELDAPALLKKALAAYDAVYAGHVV